MKYHHFGSGRYVLRMEPGEEVVSTLVAFAQERGIHAGWVNGIGSVDHAVLGFLDPKERVYLRRTFDERMEIGHLTGSMGRLPGNASGEGTACHLHATLAPRELLAYAGHLHEARVAVTVEAFVVAMEGALVRVVDPNTGFGRLLFPGEAPPAPVA